MISLLLHPGPLSDVRHVATLRRQLLHTLPGSDVRKVAVAAGAQDPAFLYQPCQLSQPLLEPEDILEGDLSIGTSGILDAADPELLQGVQVDVCVRRDDVG